MLKNYFKIAWRNLVSNKVFSSINVTGLAIGMAVAIIIGLWMYDELSFNKGHKNYDALAQIWLNMTFNNETNSGVAMSIPITKKLQTNFTSDFKHVVQTSWNFEHILAYGEKKISKSGLYTQPSLPEMLSLPMIKGTYENVLKETNSIILSESTSKAIFGEEDPMGKVIKIDNKVDVQVTGIFTDLPHNSSFKETYFYLPWALYLATEEWVKRSEEEWGNHSFQAFVQLQDNISMEAASKKISGVEKEHNKEGDPELFLHPLSKWALYSEFKEGKNIGGRIQFVWLFGIIGVFVLLLACINFMNLSTARSEKRAKEVGVRKTIGSGRLQLIGQFMSESLFTVALALCFALVIVQLSLGWFNELAGKEIALPWGNLIFWVLIISFSILTGLMSGSYPALYLSSFRPIKVLKGNIRTGRWASVPRKVLVVFQFTVSITLIIGTIIVYNQVQYAKNRPVGYSRESLLQISINTPELYNRFDVIRNELLRTGKVHEVSKSNSPMTGIWSNLIGFEWEGKDPNDVPAFGFVTCSHEHGKTIGWQIKEGRDFSREYSTDSSAFILNESAVKLTGLKDIVGKTIKWDGKPCQVIGVVKDLIMESPYTPIKPTLFKLDYEWASVIHVKLKPGIPVHDALATVEGVFKIQNPGSPFEYKFADEEYEAKFKSEERVGQLALVFAVLAIFISCLGLLGLSAYVAEQRTKEIGIRKVLGASVSQVWTMLSKDFMILVSISCLAATPIALYFLDTWLKTFDYHIEPGWLTFVIAGGMALLITLVTVSFQAIKAAVANPVKSLRTE